MELIPAPSVAFEAGCRTETIAVVEINRPTDELSHSLLVFKSKSMQMSTYKITGKILVSFEWRWGLRAWGVAGVGLDVKGGVKDCSFFGKLNRCSLTRY